MTIFGIPLVTCSSFYIPAVYGVIENLILGAWSNILSLQVLDRGEKIELLVDKTENLRSQVCEVPVHSSILWC